MSSPGQNRDSSEVVMRMRRWLRRPEVSLFALALGAYAYFYQAGGWNPNSRFDLTRAIVEQHTSIIDRYAYNTGDLSCRGPRGRCQQARAEAGEHYYSDKAPGTSWLAVPAYALAYAVFGTDRPTLRFLALSAWWVTIVAIGVPSAMAVVMLYQMLETFTASDPVRITVSLAYGLATLAFPYSTLFYGHQLAAALLLIGFAWLVRAKHLTPKPLTAGFLGGVGAVLAYAVVVEYPVAMAAIVLVGYATTFVRPWRRLVWLVVGGAIPVMALTAYHWLVFGGPLTLPYEFSTQPDRHIGFMGIGRPSRDVLWAILVSGYRGLFYSAPWLLMAIPGAMALLGRCGQRTEAIVCVVIAASVVWLNSSLVDWQGGWAMGPRYLIPAIPFLSVLVVGVVPRSSPCNAASHAVCVGGAGVALILIAASAVLMLSGTAVHPEPPMDMQHPFTEYLLPALWRGELAVNTESIEDVWPHWPGRKGDPQAWNAGQLVGLNGLASLVPLGLYVAAIGSWLAWTVYRCATGGAGSRDLG